MTPARKDVKIGLNYYGNVVLFCVDCQDTFAKSVQNKTMDEIDEIIAEHNHTQQDLDFVAELRQHRLVDVESTSGN